MTTLRDFLLDQMQKRGLSARQFAEMCDISNTAISRAISAKNPTTPDIHTLKKIAQATGVDLFTLVGLVAPDATDIDAEARIAANEIVRLPDEQRRMALTFIKGLVYDAAKESG